MKWSFANVGLIIFGFFGIIIITFFNELTVSNEQDYYTLKDAVEASMIDSVDTTYFRLTGSIKINQEKFVELLTRRFSEVATYGEGNYNLEFYQISESPPKVSIRVVDATNSYNIFGTFGADPTKVNIVNEMTAIMDVYEGGDTDPRPIKTFFPDEIDFAPLVVGGNPDNDIFEYDGNYYEVPDGTDVSDMDECELYDDRIECKNDGEQVIIFGQVNEDASCQEKDDRVECKTPEGETIIIESEVPPVVSPEIPDESVIPPVVSPEIPEEPVIPPVVPEDEPVDKIIGVQVIEYKSYEYVKKLLFGLIKGDRYKLIPKYNHYLKYNGSYYVPVDLNSPVLGENRTCKMNGTNISCVYNGNTYTYKYLSSTTSLRCFKYAINDRVFDDYYLLYNEYNAQTFLSIGAVYEESISYRKILYFTFYDKGVKRRNDDVPCYYSNENFNTFSNTGDGYLQSRCFISAGAVTMGQNSIYTIGKKNAICND